MAGEAQQIQAKVYVPGKGPGSKLQRQLTFDMISEWIRLQGLDEYTTNGLIELAGRYPTQALPSFRRNFNLMIQRVRQKRKKEMGEVEEPVTEIGQSGQTDAEESPMDEWQTEEMEHTNGKGQGNSRGNTAGQSNQGEDPDERSSGTVIYA